MSIKQHFNPVRLIMGKGAIDLLGKEVLKYGKKCLLVIQTNNEPMLEIKNRIVKILESSCIDYDVFSDIRPNPLMSDIKKGIALIQANHYDAVVAVGGGSVIDTAKVLSVSNHYDIDFASIFAQQLLPHNEKKLPLLSVPTTAGTGSHCTQAAVISDENNVKHSIYSYDFFSTVAFVDHTFTLSLPKSLTASTGFDAFCHLSESYIMGHLSSIMEVINVHAMKDIVSVLPKLMVENKEEYRETMSIADSCAGICLSNGGAIIPHAFGEAISSCVYRISHGCSLAICYPPFVEYFYDHEIYGQRIKDVIEILNYDHRDVKNGKDARMIMESFIESINLKHRLSDYEVTSEEMKMIRNAYLNQKRFKLEEVKEIIDDICA